MKQHTVRIAVQVMPFPDLCVPQLAAVPQDSVWHDPRWLRLLLHEDIDKHLAFTRMKRYLVDDVAFAFLKIRRNECPKDPFGARKMQACGKRCVHDAYQIPQKSWIFQQP